MTKTSIIFENREYNITGWEKKHPGGEQLILSANNLDITDLFKSYHKTDTLQYLAYFKSKPVIDKKQYYTFSDTYIYIQGMVDSFIEHKHSFDIVLWLSFIIYIFNFSNILSGIMLIILGAYGHQYVHSSSYKASFLTLSGFISNQWRDEHVYSHHPYTNTCMDIDLVNFMSIDNIPLPSPLRFLLVCIIIVFRPFIQYFIPKYIKRATRLDVIFILYNIFDCYITFGLGWFIKRLIPSVWFLYIDYHNHYSKGLARKQVSNDWLEQQLLTTQNVVINKFLYNKYPFVHSLLTFGLDRQVEHHVCPKVKMEYFSIVEKVLLSVKIVPRKHFVSWKSVKNIFKTF